MTIKVKDAFRLAQLGRELYEAGLIASYTHDFDGGLTDRMGRLEDALSKIQDEFPVQNQVETRKAA